MILVQPGWNGGDTFANRKRPLVEALQDSMEAAGTVVEIRELPVPDAVVSRYLEGMEGADAASIAEMKQNVYLDYPMWFTPRRFRALLSDVKGKADFVVCTMPLGRRGMEMGLLREESGLKVVLLEGSSIEFLGAALQKTALHAVMLQRDDESGWKPGSPISEDLDEAFHQRFMLVTKENFPLLAEAHPQL